MKKAGLNAFIFSFATSLSIIFIIDGFVVSKEPADNEPLISNKNIVLFINKSNNIPTKHHPIKKITLNVLPQIKEKTEHIKISLPETNITPPKPDETVIMADNSDKFEYDYISLDIEVNPQKDIIEQKDKLINKKPTHEIREQETVIANNFEDKDILLSQNKIQNHPQNEETFKLVQENMLSEQITEEPILLIPLERESGTQFKKIKITNEGQKNQVASTSKKAPINIIAPSNEVKTEKNSSEHENLWISMEEIQTEKKNSEENPWIAAVGSKHPKNNLILEANTNKDSEEIKKILTPQSKASDNTEIKLAADMVDNLIIPIPEDIKNKKNLTPQLTSSKENKYLEQELDQELGVDREDDDKIVISDAQGNNLHKENKGGFFDSISSIFSTSKNNENNYDDEDADTGIIDSISKKIGLKRKGMQILPTEIRLSFQPNRAEISGTTLQWIQAFGKKAAEEETVALEIRLDANSSPTLQQKRLNLLSNILTKRGVGSHKLRVIYTAREPNSFVIRTIRIKEKDKRKEIGYKDKKTNSRYLQW